MPGEYHNSVTAYFTWGKQQEFHTCAHAHTHTHTRIHTHIHMHAHTHSHTHTHTKYPLKLYKHHTTNLHNNLTFHQQVSSATCFKASADSLGLHSGICLGRCDMSVFQRSFSCFFASTSLSDSSGVRYTAQHTPQIQHSCTSHWSESCSVQINIMYI